MKDRALEFSLKKPYGFISEELFPDSENNVLGFMNSAAAGNRIPDLEDASGIRKYFLHLFQKQGVCKEWRSLSEYVRNFAKDNSLKTERSITQAHC